MGRFIDPVKRLVIAMVFVRPSIRVETLAPYWAQPINLQGYNMMLKNRLALIAHDSRKDLLVAWVGRHADHLENMAIVATGTTGQRISKAHPHLSVRSVKSGPLGGDQQIGALIAEGALDALIFFVDPLSPMPHDVDVKALTRLAIVYDLPMACSPSTADAVLLHLVAGAEQA